MSVSPIRLDGREGGGQLLRSALTLSLATRAPFVLEGLRAETPEPGLRSADLGYVRAAQAISGAHIEGASPGSERLVFEPGAVRPGSYLLEMGAGSVCLGLQTIALPLGLAGGSSTLKLQGGTHLPGSPAFPYLTHAWVPAMAALGHRGGVELGGAGYPPEGGGSATATVEASEPARPFDRRSRGTLREARVVCTVTNLPFSYASSQSEAAISRLREKGIQADGENLPAPGVQSHGVLCMVLAAFEHAQGAFGAWQGGPLLSHLSVGEEAAKAFVGFLESRSAVDPFLADQLLIPLAVAAAGLQGGVRVLSRLTTPRISRHLLVNRDVVSRFLDVEIELLTGPGEEAEVRVAPPGDGLVSTLRGSRAPQPPGDGGNTNAPA